MRIVIESGRAGPVQPTRVPRRRGRGRLRSLLGPPRDAGRAGVPVGKAAAPGKRTEPDCHLLRHPAQGSPGILRGHGREDALPGRLRGTGRGLRGQLRGGTANPADQAAILYRQRHSARERRLVAAHARRRRLVVTDPAKGWLSHRSYHGYLPLLQAEDELPLRFRQLRLHPRAGE